MTKMTKPDPTLALIAARFTRHDVEKSGKGYQIVDRRTANPIARLCPIPDTDRFELFYGQMPRVVGPLSAISGA